VSKTGLDYYIWEDEGCGHFNGGIIITDEEFKIISNMLDVGEELDTGYIIFRRDKHKMGAIVGFIVESPDHGDVRIISFNSNICTIENELTGEFGHVTVLNSEFKARREFTDNWIDS